MHAVPLQTPSLALTLGSSLTPSQYLAVQGLVFDYYVDEATCSMVPWEQRVPAFQYFPGNFSSLFVPTVETARLTWLLDTLMAKHHNVMFVGTTGRKIGLSLYAKVLLHAMKCNALPASSRLRQNAPVTVPFQAGTASLRDGVTAYTSILRDKLNGSA